MKTTYTTEQKKEYFASKRKAYKSALELKAALKPEYICFNAFTGKTYSLNNHCWLAYYAAPKGAFAGFDQWKRKGYQVRKGEHGFTICQPIVISEIQADGVIDKRMANVSYTTVFHSSQVEAVEGVEHGEVVLPAEGEVVQPIDKTVNEAIQSMLAF